MNTDIQTQLDQAHKRIAELEAAEAELIRVREDLRRTESKYRAAFEYTGTAMMVIEEDTSISMANHRLEEVTGWPQDEVSKGRKWSEFVAPEEMPRLLGYHIKRRTDPSSVPSEYEVLLKHRSGEWRNVLISSGMIPGTKQALISVVDITDRKRMEQNCIKSERKYRELVDNANDIIYTHDLQGNFTSCNKAGLKAYAYSIDEMLKLNISSIVDPTSLSVALKRMREKTTDGKDATVPYELLTRSKHGDPVWVEVSTRVVTDEDGKPAGIQGIARNISDHKRAEMNLVESERRFRETADMLPTAIADLDLDLKVIYANKCAIEAFGFTETDVAAGVFPRNIIASDDIDRALKDIGNVLSGQYEYGAMREFHMVRKDGSLLDMVINCSPLTTDGRPWGVRCVCFDITQRKQMEEKKLRQAQEATEKANRLVRDLRTEMVEKASFRNMVSRSPQMKQVFDILPEMAQTTATVLIAGESGTGKELIAKSLHELSERKSKPFVAINCSALPDSLLESELFGYKAGAFTDAKKDKPGKFAQAEGGTLFLDEIGDISPAMQAKLLRVLQERTYEPLGATQTVKADVRVVAATHKDLPALVKLGTFREDLFYRIKVLNVKLPPLRDRRCDIPLLCDHFIGQFNARYHKEVRDVGPEALNVLLAHQFPGNIRELENIVEHAFIFCKGATIELHHLPSELTAELTAAQRRKDLGEIKDFDELERIYLRSVLDEVGGSKIKASQRLGIHKTTLFRKLKSLGMD